MKSWLRSGYYTLFMIIIIMVTLLLLFQFRIKDFINGNYSNYDKGTGYENFNSDILKKNPLMFSDYKYDEMNELYFTALEDKRIHGTFTEYINQYEENDDGEAYDVYFVDKSKGVLGNGVFIREPNAEVILKGKTPFKRVQKSFKIRLYDNEGLWKNQSIINLEKNEPDPLRIRNKLTLDSFRLVNNVIPPRTSFVRLFVRDLNENVNSTEFEDFGLYIQVEDVSRMYFVNRGLDSNSYLYEINNFEFQNLSLGDLDRENRLNIKSITDKTVIEDLIYSVNNMNRDINSIVEEYFDKEHLFNWITINILTGNRRFVDRDHYLYKPLNTDKWYFIPYDCDDSFGRSTDIPSWEKGIGLLYKNNLYERIITNKTLLEELKSYMDKNYLLINKESITMLLETYYDEFFSNMSVKPDIKSLKIEYEDLQIGYENLSNYPKEAYDEFAESLKAPMPFKSQLTLDLSGQKKLVWEKSVSLLDQHIEYKIEIAKDKRFERIIVSEFNIESSEYIVPTLEKGTYYYKIMASSENGYSTIMRNEYKDEFDNIFYGVGKITIE